MMSEKALTSHFAFIDRRSVLNLISPNNSRALAPIRGRYVEYELSHDINIRSSQLMAYFSL